METSRGAMAWRPLTPEALAQAKTMLRSADHGALATLVPEDHWPRASRVGIACFADGTPMIIASSLASHFRALAADSRCGLLVGAVGKGDPLAHPRLSLACRAMLLAPDSNAANDAKSAYLGRHPKAAIYVDLPDFRFFRLEIVDAEFNAGFGRAYRLQGAQLLG
jgi:putative heme iron utilization protein